MRSNNMAEMKYNGGMSMYGTGDGYGYWRNPDNRG